MTSHVFSASQLQSIASKHCPPEVVARMLADLSAAEADAERARLREKWRIDKRRQRGSSDDTLRTESRTSTRTSVDMPSKGKNKIKTSITPKGVSEDFMKVWKSEVQRNRLTLLGKDARWIDQWEAEFKLWAVGCIIERKERAEAGPLDDDDRRGIFLEHKLERAFEMWLRKDPKMRVNAETKAKESADGVKEGPAGAEPASVPVAKSKSYVQTADMRPTNSDGSKKTVPAPTKGKGWEWVGKATSPKRFVGIETKRRDVPKSERWCSGPIIHPETGEYGFEVRIKGAFTPARPFRKATASLPTPTIINGSIATHDDETVEPEMLPGDIVCEYAAVAENGSKTPESVGQRVEEPSRSPAPEDPNEPSAKVKAEMADAERQARIEEVRLQMIAKEQKLRQRDAELNAHVNRKAWERLLSGVKYTVERNCEPHEAQKHCDEVLSRIEFLDIRNNEYLCLKCPDEDFAKWALVSGLEELMVSLLRREKSLLRCVEWSWPTENSLTG